MAHFLDTHFHTQKVERIKYLADLHTRISHFFKEPKNGENHTHIQTLGIHMIDKELEEKYA